MASLSDIQQIPPKSMVLLVGVPGSGKSMFCRQTVLQNLLVDRPIIYVTTEYDPSDAEKALRELGLGDVEPGLLSFVDAYNETVGVAAPDRPDTIVADCSNLSNLDIAISKLQERTGKKDILLVFDSLVSPYLLSGQEVLRFMRLSLSRFVAEGNSVLACMDEGCGKQEDLGAMMSLSSGVLRAEVAEGKMELNIVKHPELKPGTVEIPITQAWEKLMEVELWDQGVFRRFLDAQQSGQLSEEFAQFKVNVFWPIFGRLGGVIWDPKRFPEMNYQIWKEWSFAFKDIIPLFPWRMRLMLRLFTPKSYSTAKDMKKFQKFLEEFVGSRLYGIIEYVEDISGPDEHYFRVYESYECCEFEGVGTTMASTFPPMIAGTVKALEHWKGLERDWNAIETKCIGLGDPYCEFKLVPGEIAQLGDSLEKDSIVIERAFHERLVHRLMEFMLKGSPLIERARLGSDFIMEGFEMTLPAMVSEKYRTAFRMGAAKTGKMVGEHMREAGLEGDEAVQRLVQFLEQCNVGKVTVGGTIRIENNCESRMTQFMTTKLDEPLCFFTTGFLNGFFSAIKGQHVKETKCIAVGDPYCEWEFR